MSAAKLGESLHELLTPMTPCIMKTYHGDETPLDDITDADIEEALKVPELGHSVEIFARALKIPYKSGRESKSNRRSSLPNTTTSRQAVLNICKLAQSESRTSYQLRKAVQQTIDEVQERCLMLGQWPAGIQDRRGIISIPEPSDPTAPPTDALPPRPKRAIGGQLITAPVAAATQTKAPTKLHTASGSSKTTSPDSGAGSSKPTSASSTTSQGSRKNTTPARGTLKRMTPTTKETTSPSDEKLFVITKMTPDLKKSNSTL